MKQVCKFSEVAASVLDSLLPKREGRRQKANGCYNGMSLLRKYILGFHQDDRIKQIYNAVNQAEINRPFLYSHQPSINTFWFCSMA